MAYKVFIDDDKKWRKDCSRIDRKQLRKILLAIRALEQDPWAENIQVKYLENYPTADFRLRVGDYRVLFDKDEEKKMIFLFRVLHRSKLY